MAFEKVKEALEPIKRGLFGKQGEGGYRYERPHFPLRSLPVMLRDLVEIDEVDYRGYIFARDPLKGKYSDQQMYDWMVNGIACGKEWAHRLSEEYKTESPEDLSREMGMKVSYPQYPEKSDRVLFAEFRAPNDITVYMDAVNKGKKLLDQKDIRKIMTDELNISSVLLAHELFHYVEEKYKKEIYSRTEKVRLWAVGPVHNDSTIPALSEICAMSFAREMTHLPYACYVLDVFLGYSYSPEEASGVYQEMMERAGRKPCAASRK